VLICVKDDTFVYRCENSTRSGLIFIKIKNIDPNVAKNRNLTKT